MALEPMTTPARIPQFFEKQQAGEGFSIPKETNPEGVPDGQEEVSLAR